MANTLSFVGGLVLGAVVGAAAAMLAAPQAGNEFQVLIRERVNLVLQEGQRAADERRAELEAQFAQAKQFQKLPAEPLQ